MVLLFLVSKLPELKCVEYVACGYAYVDVPHLGTIIGFEFNSHLVALYLSSETIVVNQSVIHFVHFYRQHAFLVHFRFGEPKSRIVPAYKNESSSMFRNVKYAVGWLYVWRLYFPFHGIPISIFVFAAARC